MYSSLPSDPAPVQNTYLQNDDDAPHNFEQRTLQQLRDIDPFRDMVIFFTLYITYITKNID